MRARLERQAQDPEVFDTVVEALQAARGHVWFTLEIEIVGLWIEIIDRTESRRLRK